jgi:hypothetical protein
MGERLLYARIKDGEFILVIDLFISLFFVILINLRFTSSHCHIDIETANYVKQIHLTG